MKKLVLAIVLAMALLPASAGARGRGGDRDGDRDGGHWGGSSRVVIVPEIGFGYGWYDPFWGPFGYPYPYPPYAYSHPKTGRVKLETKARNAEVYINGSYAGTVGELKSIRLKTGSYTIEIRDAGGHSYKQKVFVAPGKTIHLYPNFGPNNG